MFSEPIVGEERVRLTQEVLMLRARGYSVRRVAANLNIGRTLVCNLTNEALDIKVATLGPDALRYRTLRMEQCQEMMDDLSEHLMIQDGEDEKGEPIFKPDPEIYKTMLKIMEREANYAGLNSPTRVENETKSVDKFSSDEARKKAFADYKKKYPTQKGEGL